MEESASILTLPDVDRVHFKKNFIKTAVCELRFPALLEFETNPPTLLQKELRKDFPHYERQQSIRIDQPTEKEYKHLLRSKKGDWLVSFKSTSIALETGRYTHFENFLEQLELVLKRSLRFLDTDFFTRVGLRYINEIKIEDSVLDGWIRDDLIGPLSRGVYGTVERFIQEVRGHASSGKYTFRHGFVSDKPDLYSIDMDFYNETIEADQTLTKVTELNKESFKLFWWTIGPKIKERLGNPLPASETR
ncbi:MAG: TIGR04255 family protein [Candidatus Binatia bacterium]